MRSSYDSRQERDLREKVERSVFFARSMKCIDHVVFHRSRHRSRAKKKKELHPRRSTQCMDPFPSEWVTFGVTRSVGRSVVFVPPRRGRGRGRRRGAGRRDRATPLRDAVRRRRMVLKTERCSFSGARVYPGHGTRLTKVDSVRTRDDDARATLATTLATPRAGGSLRATRERRPHRRVFDGWRDDDDARRARGYSTLRERVRARAGAATRRAIGGRRATTTMVDRVMLG